MWAGHSGRLITGHSTRQSRIQVRLGGHLGRVELAKEAGNVQGKIDMLIITGLIKAGFFYSSGNKGRWALSISIQLYGNLSYIGI